MDEQSDRRPGCGTWSIVANHQGASVAVPLRCRNWQCGPCSSQMRRRLTHLIADAAPTSLLTLTCKPALHASPESARLAMRAAWPKLVKRIRRLVEGQEVEYVAVWELTRAGWPHLHVALRAPFIPQRWLSAQWAELTGASVVDIRAMFNALHAARYLAKYLTKALESPPGFRRWSASSGMLLEPMRPRPRDDDNRPEWELVRESSVSLAMRWAREGLSIDNGPGDVMYAIDPELSSGDLLELIALEFSSRAPPDLLTGEVTSIPGWPATVFGSPPRHQCPRSSASARADR